jgi:hypothetical protein
LLGGSQIRQTLGRGGPAGVVDGVPFSGIAMWTSSHEQSHGRAPGRPWLHEGDAVSVLSVAFSLPVPE